MKTHTAEHTGPRRWNDDLSIHMNEDSWKKVCTSLKNLCKETKLREFQFKLIHRTIVTKKSYTVLVLNQMMTAYTVEKKIPLTIDSKIVGSYFPSILRLLSGSMREIIQSSTHFEEKLFGLDTGPHNKELVKKFNYTMLYMRYYIYSCKLYDKAIILGDFVNKLLLNYKIEKL